MIRSRRTNSDLYGIQKMKNTTYSETKASSSKNLDTSCRSQRQHSSKQINDSFSQKAPKKTDSQETILNTFKLLKYFYKDQCPEYLSKVQKYLTGEWQQKRKNFMEHLNKLVYMQSEMHKKTFEEIEVDVVKEWRKNPVLYYIRATWYQYISSNKVKSLKELSNKYHLFKEFVGQLAYLFFGQFFSKRTEKQIECLLTKLSNRTSHYIITDTTSWANLCFQSIMPLIHKSYHLENVTFGNNLQEINLTELGIKSIVLDTSSKQLQTPQTTMEIKNFILETKLRQKLQLLKQIRAKMEDQLMKRQKELIKIGKLKNITILDKDDFIDCLVYAILKGGISLSSLAISLRLIHTLLGQDFDEVLSKLKVDMYFADLEAAYGFLIDYQNRQQQKQNRSSNLENLNVSLK